MEDLLNSYALNVLLLGTILLVLFAVISLKKRKLSEDSKKMLFGGIITATIIPTLLMAGSTIYLNTISSSGGPVHWHADFEVWSCGRQVELVDPKGFSNKIGTATLHEHNDKRIHLEGLVMESLDASLGNFFNVVGGHLSTNSFSMPTTDGDVYFENGQSCQEGVAEVQVFVYRTDENNQFFQEKLDNPVDFIIRDNSAVPPGDCIIVEFDTPKDKTDKLCKSYQVAEEIEEIERRPNGN